MKQKTCPLIYSLKLVFLAFSVVNCSSAHDKSAQEELAPEQKNVADLVDLIQNIETMTKVNDEPFIVSTMMIVLCRMPSDAEIITEEHGGPHKGMAINVYVNDIGKTAMTRMKNPIYPVGTVLIKEKFPIEISQQDLPKDVELYTIMIKREKGYNPECGDWEFGAIDGKLKEAEQGKLESCMKCHQTKNEMDYVFRDDYLAERYMNNIYNMPLLSLYQ